MIIAVSRLMEWVDSNKSIPYNELFNRNIGIYYLVIGMLDSAGLCEHGVSIRYPWLTEKGEEFLKALQTISISEIDNCKGESYDGNYYNS